MKSFIVLTALSFFVLSCSQNPTNPNPNPNPPATEVLNGWEKIKLDRTIADISFVTPAKGFICGEIGGISKSLDSGRTWTKVSLLAFTNITSTLNWLNPQYGYCVGAGFAYTTDGGDNWKSKPFPAGGFDVAFTTPAHGCVTASGGLYQTIDTGNTWKQLYPGYWTGLAFKNSLEGWAARYDSGLYRTTDGGATWTLQKRLPGVRIITITFFNDDLGWFTCEDLTNNQILWRTVDKGNTWTNVNFPVKANPFGIQFVTDKIGYMTADSVIYKSTDGGLNWKEEVKIPFLRLAEIFFLNENYGWAESSTGTILRYRKP